MPHELKTTLSARYEDETGVKGSVVSPLLSINLSAAKVLHTTQTVGTIEEALLLGDISSRGTCILVNRNTQHYIEVKVATGGAIYAKLWPLGSEAGINFCFLNLGSGAQSPYVIASGESEMEILLVPVGSATALPSSAASTGYSHAELDDLNWAASGHTGTASMLAAFDSDGAASYVSQAAYDAAGSAAAVLVTANAYTDSEIAALSSVYQPLDADLTAIAALTTVAYGRSLLTLANATALAAEVDSFFLTPTEGNAAYQPLDSDLTAIAALTTTTYGRSLLTLANATALAAEVDGFFLTPAEGNAAYQPLDADLTAIAALSGTDTIYYRSAANTWSAVTLGANMTFVAGELNSTGSLDINGLTGADIALDDEIPGYDITATANRKFTVERIGGFVHPAIADGRLTTESGVAISTSDRTSQGTIYYTPYIGNRIALYDGTRWKLYAFTERSLALTATSGKVYDVFLYDNAGTLTLELSAAWTDATTRADALTTQDGVTVKSGATTRRWVGTFYASGSNVTDDADSLRLVWNAYNQVPRRLRVIDATDSWTYSTATFRQANAAASNKVQVVVGNATSHIALTVTVLASVDVQAGATVAIGEDSTTTRESTQLLCRVVPNAFQAASSTLEKAVPLGYHYYAWLEKGAGSGTQTWYGDGADNTLVQSGVIGYVMG